jgi:Mn2+/Fe2+ NRAMP family transporter
LSTSFVDANQLFTGCSAAGMIHLLNKTPICWFSMKLNTVETSTYGSEFSALPLLIAVDQVMSICQDLRYLGVPIAGLSYIFTDNKAVVDSSVNPSYRLKKRHKVLSWHTVCQVVACNIVQIVHIDCKNNPADILTKHRNCQEWYELCKPIIL